MGEVVLAFYLGILFIVIEGFIYWDAFFNNKIPWGK